MPHGLFPEYSPDGMVGHDTHFAKGPHTNSVQGQIMLRGKNEGQSESVESA